MTTDSEIIRRSRDRPADFGELFDRHATALHRYAARRTNPSVADDILSETFLVAFERRTGFDHDRDDARPWLFGIATNLLRHHYRAEARMLAALPRAVEHDRHDGDLARSTERLDAERAVSHLAATLKGLSPHDRDALLLYAWANLTYDEIAEATGVPPGTVASRLNRTRRLLRETAATDPSSTTTSNGTSHGRPDPAPHPA
ncbi:RNA polymerase sigma factor [Frondihabitans cladoniiphilus]|uniref:RNA polymerase sigma factor n=1 Tax=Frondihabitans cladoniiphilus TaxID=715785 RepID=UPI0031ECDAD7